MEQNPQTTCLYRFTRGPETGKPCGDKTKAGTKACSGHQGAYARQEGDSSSDDEAAYMRRMPQFPFPGSLGGGFFAPNIRK